MISILVVCAGGISTSFLVQNMKQALENHKLKGTIQARAITEVAEHIDQSDVVLIAPQAQFLKSRVEELCTLKKKPCGLIPMNLYGAMDGEKVLDLALNLQKKEKGG